ncbi:MAG: prephenate dehydrogenase/arogenate dehydrogenase family protein [Gammaproteobacteria bacterium]
MIDRLVIIGVGLIGGSLGLALKKAGACREVVGCGRTPLHLKKAVELGVIDRYETDIGRAAQDADMVVLAVPVGVIEASFEQLAGHLSAHTVFTDVGSTKGSVVAAAQRVFKQVPAMFVPGHPIAGTEKSGVTAATAELFQQRRVVLTPLPDTSPDALAKVRQMWKWTGAEIVETSVEHHDAVLAATSHLPHLLAYTLVDSLARMDASEEIFRFAAGGFNDFTRIAGSSPQMWHDICLANGAAILKMIEHFDKDLIQLATAIRDGDGAQILDLFTRAKTARDRFETTKVISMQERS